MNMTVTNVDLGNVVIEGVADHDQILTLGGADIIAEGTILARKAVDDAVTASAITGTGNGTVTAASVVAGPIVPLVGAYVLTCTLAVTNGGVFKLEDPNGALVADNLEMTPGAGAAIVFEVGGLTFTITDGSTDFVAGDTATLTVAADGNLTLFATDGAGGAQFPKAVLTYEKTVTAGGDFPVRVLERGKVNFNRLVIDADGDNSNVTNAVMDQLRDYGIEVVKVQELSTLDNQA